ncbi:MAG: DUF4112 domain-containing protein [Bosea sp. (in: a-proteobacteria)]
MNYDSPQRVDALAMRLKRVALITRVTDTAVTFPGTDVKIGLDAIIGAVPVAGDVVMASVALVLINDARHLGVPKADLARMLRNTALDTVIGAIPFIGDLFDIVYRSNERNLRLIEKHIGRIDAATVDLAPNKVRAG